MTTPTSAAGTDSFVARHVGPSEDEVAEMLAALGYETLDDLVAATIPAGIRMKGRLAIGEGLSEAEALKEFRAVAAKNEVYRSFIGLGYYGCIVPPVIQRNVLENPAWYTAYTPYQAEIAQGRLEALLNYQTMVIDLTGLPVANASLLDEATAAAEAMALSYGVKGAEGKETFFVSERCHPQTIDVVRTRAWARGFEVVVGDHESFEFGPSVFGALVQYPASDGAVCDYREFTERAHAADALVTVAADPLALALLVPPGEWGADIAVGSTQRFGVPMGYGGPHAAYFATRDEFKRQIPGRIIGVSRDAEGRPALRMALQTREQHIRREKATSNVCTAQVLLAVMASMYAVWHGPAGIERIASRVHDMAGGLAEGLRRLGFEIADDVFFDTLRVELGDRGTKEIVRNALAKRINLRVIDDTAVGISLGEDTTIEDIDDLLAVFNGGKSAGFAAAELVSAAAASRYDERFARQSAYLTHPVFNTHHSETEMLRYMRKLESRDLSLVHSMIPLGSCTMKLNATAEMFPITWPEIGGIHPFAPVDQA
ncbi:MAG TPA: glycine dehydrogenase (aminomethyl-transferring), partial [Gemmatimonadaceae bacterium]|nr:glycine dehydrogenase (aminomethyl-transferring) [Gemmatimonadaceae bacterium]